MLPEFSFLEYQARDPDNLSILRTCSGRWVRNKDTAQAAGMTPAGAKRRNDFLEGIGLLERRRRGKEVQYCTTILSYLANLGLAEENRAASMGAIQLYLDLTRPYSERLLRDLGIGPQPGGENGQGEEGGAVGEVFEDGKTFFGLVAYLWPLDTLSQVQIDLPGFNRKGARILTINDIVLPIPRLGEEEYDQVLGTSPSARDGETQTGTSMEGLKEALLRSLMTGRARVTDYGEQRAFAQMPPAGPGTGAKEYLWVVSRLREILMAWGTKGPLLQIIIDTLDTVIDESGDMGVPGGGEPGPAPVGVPGFPILESFSEERYGEIIKRFTPG